MWTTTTGGARTAPWTSMLQTRSASLCPFRGPYRGPSVDEIDSAACSMNTSSRRDDRVYAPYAVKDRATDLIPAHREALDAAFGLTDGPAPEHFRIAMASLDL